MKKLFIALALLSSSAFADIVLIEKDVSFDQTIKVFCINNKVFVSVSSKSITQMFDNEGKPQQCEVISEDKAVYK